ncbi:MAG: diacylglycerol kinase family lipid kinase [Dehalococcoidales bacterium]|nr:diacylglycerol kinase family lipid kinase [Dehalococcoidales bacterium]
MSYARLIVNPAAGAGRTAKKWPYIKQLLKKIGLKFEHDITEAPGHAIELAKSAVGKGYKLIVSVGGDGTINEIVNGLYVTGGIKDVELGIIGTGTGSDYIRTIGVSKHYQESCQHLMNPVKMSVDLGMVESLGNGQANRRLFANFAGLGFDAEVVRATTKKFKSLGGKPAYLMGLLSTFLTYKNHEVRLILDGQKEDRKICTIVMSNGKYGGGSMLIAPGADPSDGLFDVLIIGNISKPDLLCSLPRIYRGTHLTHPKVTLKRAKVVEIHSEGHMSIQADGELLGEAPARFTVLPSALNILV